jgi:hypothetical protein
VEEADRTIALFNLPSEGRGLLGLQSLQLLDALWMGEKTDEHDAGQEAAHVSQYATPPPTAATVPMPWQQV